MKWAELKNYCCGLQSWILLDKKLKMAYNEILSLQVQNVLLDTDIEFFEKKMFGGNAFMINDKMCIGVVKNELMLRVIDEQYEKVLEMNLVRPMDFTGKIMKGFVYIEEEALKTKKELLFWIDLGIEFGKKGSVKSKKKKK